VSTEVEQGLQSVIPTLSRISRVYSVEGWPGCTPWRWRRCVAPTTCSTSPTTATTTANPPPPLGPEGRGLRSDDCGGGAGRGGGVAVRAVEEDEDPGLEVDPG